LYRNRNLYISVKGLVSIVLATAIIVFMVTAAVFMGWNFFHPKYKIEFEPQEVSGSNVRKFNQVREILKNDFYKEVDENILLEGAVRGMADSLQDVHTVYYTKEQMDKLMEISNKSYESYVGIGVTVVMDNDGLLTVVEPFDNSPALEVGIKPGDKIIKVDGQDVTGIKDQDIIIDMIKGPENTLVKITVYRPSELRPIDFEIKRRKMNVVLNIRGDILEGNIGYIRISSFNDRNISSLFLDNLDKLLEQGINGLVIDVRDNLGGYYDEVVKIADRLLPEGVIVYTEDRERKQRIERSDKTELDIPLAILINENSASASEVLAGAVKDHGKGVLIGMRTFGKGVVQQIKLLDDGSGLKVTISRYFTPSGVCIQDIGIQPDIEVPIGEKYENTPVSRIPREEDLQLRKAVDEIKMRMKLNNE
jgi:carboxyl-terminal processing protease